MGSGGGVFDSNDIFDNIRMNQKSRFVGTGEQATTFITSPQVGQIVFTTESDGTFTVDKTSIRNAANSAWINNVNSNGDYDNDLEGGTTTAVSWKTSGGNEVINMRTYTMLTFPTTYDFYIITHMELWIRDVSDTSTGFQTQWGADRMNANPPTNDHTELVALAQCSDITSALITNTYTNFKRKCASKIIRNGDHIGFWANATITTGEAQAYGRYTGTRYYRDETFTTTPPTAFGATFNTFASGEGIPRIKIYCKGFSIS